MGRAEMLYFVHFTETITLGSIILGVMLACGGLATYGYGVRWKSAFEAESAARESLEDGRRAYQLRADRLAEEKSELLILVGDCKAKVAALEARPTQETVVQLIEAMDAHASERTMKAVASVERSLATHERLAQERFGKQTERAQERHEMQMDVMNEIVTALQRPRAA